MDYNDYCDFLMDTNDFKMAIPHRLPLRQI